MKVKQIFRLSVLFLCFYIISTPVQAAEEAYYYIDVSVQPEGYAEFEIYVQNYGIFENKVIELPILKCEENLEILDVHKRIKVLDIPDIQTLQGHIDLNESCLGVGIEPPRNFSQKDFTISFIYKNSDWELHPEKYPLDHYNMAILISFPKIRSEDKAHVFTRILLPENTRIKNNSAFRYFEHPFTTQHTGNPIYNSSDIYGNQQILQYENFYLTKNMPSQAIYIPLEFERVGFIPNFFYLSSSFLVFILILLTWRTFKGKISDSKGEILTIAILSLSYYQILNIDKPTGIMTYSDKAFLFFTGWTLLLFLIDLIISYSQKNKNVYQEFY